MQSEIKYLLPQQRNISKGSKNWYGGIVRNGVTRWASLYTKSEKAAKEWYNKMQASRFAPKHEQQQAEQIKISHAVKAFLLDVEKVRRRAAGTVHWYRTILEPFNKYCETRNVFFIHDLKPGFCSELAQSVLAELEASTAKVKVVLLRSFFNWTVNRYGLLLRNPFKQIVAPKTPSKPREFWTVEECEKIIAAAGNPERKCCFAIMAFAGLRISEARRLKMENLDGRKISFVRKGGEHQTVPISSKLKSYIDEYLAIRGTDAGSLFPDFSKPGKAGTYIIQKAVEMSGVQNGTVINFHRFRHSFASNLIRIGRSIKAVQMLMCHKNVTLTLNTYSHLLPSDLEEAVEL
jgi:site-specific recombinase XerD